MARVITRCWPQLARRRRPGGERQGPYRVVYDVAVATDAVDIVPLFDETMSLIVHGTLCAPLSITDAGRCNGRIVAEDRFPGKRPIGSHVRTIGVQQNGRPSPDRL
jgi:hypothetical protein